MENGEWKAMSETRKKQMDSEIIGVDLEFVRGQAFVRSHEDLIVFQPAEGAAMVLFELSKKFPPGGDVFAD